MPINPVASAVHVDVPLTNFAQLYAQKQESFVAMRAMPNIPSAKQSDLYWLFSRPDFYRDEMEERADGAETKGSGFTVSTTPYFARVYGHHKLVTDRQRANSDPRIDLERSATRFVTHKGLIRRERLFAAAYMGTGIWGSQSDPDWSAGGADDPIVDLRDRASTIHSRSGYRPNKLILGRRAWDTIQDNDAFLARITGGADPNMPAVVRRQLLAQLLEIEQVFVMDGVFNSAAKGAAEASDFIVANTALLYYAPDTVGPDEPTAGTQFSWTGYLPGQTENGIVISRLRDDHKRADKIEGEMAFVYQVTGATLGHFFSNVTA